MQFAMEDFDDDLTIIQLKADVFDLMDEPPALPFPLVRRKDGLDVARVYELTARRMSC